MPREKTVRTLRVIAGTSAIILAVWVLSDVILIIFFAALLAVLLRGVAGAAVRSTHAAEGVMLAAITLPTASALFGFGYWLGPQLVAQVQQLASQLSGEVAHLKGLSNRSPV